MKPRRRVVLSEVVRLEDRVVLSGVGAAAEVAGAAVQPQNLRATFRGRYLTTLPSGLGGGESAQLNGAATIAQAGRIRLSGTLSSNGSLPPPFSGTQGTLTVVGSRRLPGSATLAVTGPTSDLSPNARTFTRLTFTVTSASGKFSPLLHQDGEVDLTLRKARLLAGGSSARGQFTMVLREG